jgi:hypothetical protein
MRLDALEGLFDAPAGVIQITKAFGREVAGLQMGGQQARLAGKGLRAVRMPCTLRKIFRGELLGKD